MSNSSYLEYYNIQKPEEGVGLVAYSGQTSMSSAGQKVLDKTDLNKPKLIEGLYINGNDEDIRDVQKFMFGTLDGLTDSNKMRIRAYDMSNNLLNFPQGHPLYVPQTIAETYSSDARALVDMEELVMGFALIGGITVMIVGLLINKGIVGPNSGGPPPTS
jgi:hypothetical protein